MVKGLLEVTVPVLVAVGAGEPAGNTITSKSVIPGIGFQDTLAEVSPIALIATPDGGKHSGIPHCTKLSVYKTVPTNGAEATFILNTC